MILLGVLVLCVLALLPIWVPRLLPLTDLPSHLAALSAWRHLGDPNFGFDRFYERGALLFSGVGYYAPVYALSQVLPIEVANRVVLSIAVLALPLSLLLLARSLGRSAWLAAFALPLAYSALLGAGALCLIAAIPTLTASLAVYRMYCAEPSRRRLAVFIALTSYLATLDPLLWCVAPLAALLWKPSRVMLLTPSAIVAAVVARDLRAPFTAHWDPLVERIADAPTYWLTSSPSVLAFVLISCWIVVWIALVITARDDDARPSSEHYAIELLLLVLATLALALPDRVLRPIEMPLVAGRFVVLLALWLPLTIRGPISGVRRALLVALLVATGVYLVTLTLHWERFGRRADSLRRLLSEVPQGASTLILNVDRKLDDPDVAPAYEPYRHLHAYAQLWSGGADAWPRALASPVRAKTGAQPPAPRADHAIDFSMTEHGAHWDYLVTKGEAYERSLIGPDDHWRVEALRRDGAFELYRLKRP